MIERKDLLALDFYKKAPFFGSYNKMYYKIERVEAKPESEIGDTFKVTYWPGPNNYKNTADELKEEADFPFSNEGLEAVSKFLNEQYDRQKERWDSVVIR